MTVLFVAAPPSAPIGIHRSSPYKYVATSEPGVSVVQTGSIISMGLPSVQSPISGDDVPATTDGSVVAAPIE